MALDENNTPNEEYQNHHSTQSDSNSFVKKKTIKFIEDRHTKLIKPEKNRQEEQAEPTKKAKYTRWKISTCEDFEEKVENPENQLSQDIATNENLNFNESIEKDKLNSSYSDQKRKNVCKRDITESFSSLHQKRDNDDLLNYEKGEEFDSLKPDLQINERKMREKPSTSSESRKSSKDSGNSTEKEIVEPFKRMRASQTLETDLFQESMRDLQKINSPRNRPRETPNQKVSSTQESSLRKKAIDYLVEEAKLEKRHLERQEEQKNIQRKEMYRMLKLQEKELNAEIEELDEKGTDDDMFLTVIENDTKMYICPHTSCNKKFPSLSRVKRHYIVHTGQKPYKCLNKNCRKSFSRKDNMLQHFRNHCYLSRKTKFSEYNNDG